jgi:hypothetical protein
LQEHRYETIEELWVYGSHVTIADNVDGTSLINFINSAGSGGNVNRVYLLRDIEYAYLKNIDPALFIKFKILTLGPRRDSFFAVAHYLQLMTLLKSTRKVISNYPTTLLLYANTLSCEISFIEDSNFESALSFAISENDVPLQTFLKKGFIGQKDLDDYVNEILGVSSFRSREELRKLVSPYASRLMPIRVWNSFSSWFRTLLP